VIANRLLFNADGEPLLVLTGGARCVDTADVDSWPEKCDMVWRRGRARAHGAAGLLP
jgi:hypothetical protein